MELNTLYVDIEATDLSADIGNLLSIGYKWKHEKKPHVLSLLDYPGRKINDDSRLIEAFRPVLEKANLVVHHFGDFYDYPFLRTRCLVNNLSPLPEIQTVDTWRICKKRLKLGSNSLQRVLSILHCPIKKTPVDIMIWADARVGDKNAMKYVIHHNQSDVLIQEFVHKALAPLWPSHPRMVLTEKEMHCKLCGGRNHGKGTRPTRKCLYRRVVCSKCGHNDIGEKLS